jgi:phosphoribosylformylglycinamidine synthase
MVDEVSRLAHVVPVLHDVSDGGLAVAVAEVCIASGVGAVIDVDDPVDLFGEDPHRVVAMVDPGWGPLPSGRRVGTMGGPNIVLGGEVVSLVEASRRWHRARGDALAAVPAPDASQPGGHTWGSKVAVGHLRT